MAATPKQRAALDLYAELMEEVKIRISSMDMAMQGRTGLPGALAREFCFLQLRMLCELIALGCLTAHGDIEESTKLRKEYAADKIIEQLEQLHPHFYPRACKQTKRGPHLFDAIMMKDDEGFLTKPELLKLYGKCGDSLHRGSLKKLLSPTSAIQRHFRDIVEWQKKIVTLLDYHAIFLIEKKSMVLFVLRNIDNNNRVNWALVEGESLATLLDEPK